MFLLPKKTLKFFNNAHSLTAHDHEGPQWHVHKRYTGHTFRKYLSSLSVSDHKES